MKTKSIDKQQNICKQNHIALKEEVKKEIWNDLHISILQFLSLSLAMIFVFLTLVLIFSVIMILGNSLFFYNQPIQNSYEIISNSIKLTLDGNGIIFITSILLLILIYILSEHIDKYINSLNTHKGANK